MMNSKAAILAYAWKVLTFLAVICLIWQYMLPRSYFLEAWNANTMKPTRRMYQEASGHILVNKTTIPIGEPVRGGNNIMFVETSCLVKSANATYKIMSVRQTCSVESAARMNPDAHVYLLHSCPIKFTREGSVSQLLKYSNIKFWKISLNNLMSGTPLQSWDYNSALSGSAWPLEHASDVVRFVLLWKYGGLYMDLDFVVIKSVASLQQNFVCDETEKNLGSSVIKMQSDGIGHRLAEICVQQLARDFRGDIWSYNGPQRITNGLLELCDGEEQQEKPTTPKWSFRLHPLFSIFSASAGDTYQRQLSDIDPKNCNVTVYKSEVFFPVAYWEWAMLFTESDSAEVAKRIKNSYGVHIWNKLSSEEKVYVGSKQPYNTLAQKFCPFVHSTSNEFF